MRIKVGTGMLIPGELLFTAVPRLGMKTGSHPQGCRVRLEIFAIHTSNQVHSASPINRRVRGRTGLFENDNSQLLPLIMARKHFREPMFIDQEKKRAWQTAVRQAPLRKVKFIPYSSSVSNSMPSRSNWASRSSRALACSSSLQGSISRQLATSSQRYRVSL